MKLEPCTALIPIDLQQGFDDPSWPRRNNPALDANGRRLLKVWRAAEQPVIHVRHDSVEPGSTLRPENPGNAFRPGFEPQAGEPLVSKSVNCAFLGTDLELRLRRLGAGAVVFFGLSTDMCVSTTVRIASNLGFRTIVAADACACFDLLDESGSVIPAEAVHAAHLATLRAEFAEVATTDQIIAALGATTPRTREIALAPA